MPTEAQPYLRIASLASLIAPVARFNSTAPMTIAPMLIEQRGDAGIRPVVEFEDCDEPTQAVACSGHFRHDPGMERYTVDDDATRPKPVAWDDYESWLMERWNALLDVHSNDESKMQEFLEQHPCLLPDPTGSHHGVVWQALIRQPELKGLGRDRFPDFMWIRRDTVTIRPVCIEIEAPGKRWFNRNRTPNAKLTQALDQIVDWKVWFSLPENQLIFRQRYVPPKMHDRRIEPEFVLVYGRDSEFRPGPSAHDHPEAIRRKRDFMRRRNEHFFTYDRLRPALAAANYVTLTIPAEGFELSNVPPTFTTGPGTRTLAIRIADPSAAFARAELMSERRKKYLVGRWQHWRKQATASSRPYSLSSEFGE
jgi:hypothetical protein